jgi:hypothetical protein
MGGIALGNQQNNVSFSFFFKVELRGRRAYHTGMLAALAMYCSCESRKQHYFGFFFGGRIAGKGCLASL